MGGAQSAQLPKPCTGNFGSLNYSFMNITFTAMNDQKVRLLPRASLGQTDTRIRSVQHNSSSTYVEPYPSPVQRVSIEMAGAKMTRKLA